MAREGIPVYVVREVRQALCISARQARLHIREVMESLKVGCEEAALAVRWLTVRGAYIGCWLNAHD